MSGTTYAVWDTAAGLRAAIIKRFGPTVTALQSVHAVSDLKQRADESCADFMDRIRLAVDMLHYNVPPADKTEQAYQDSFARLVKAHFGAGLRPEIGKVVLGVTTLPATMDAYLQAAEAIESELARSLKVPVLAVHSQPDGPSALADLTKKFDDLVAFVKGGNRSRPSRGRGRGRNSRGRGGASSSSSAAVSSGGRFANVQCWNCGEYGHTVTRCSAPDNPHKQAQLKAAFESNKARKQTQGQRGAYAAAETPALTHEDPLATWSFSPSGN